MRYPQNLKFYHDWGSLFVIALLFLWPACLHGLWPGTGVDLFGTVWFYGWVRHSLEIGVNPSFTDLFFYPDGKEIFAHTGNNLVDAYASVPFQWLFGDYFIGPFVMALVLLNVIGLRWFLREMGASIYVRWLMSVLWMFNPFIWSELAMGRPTQVLMFPTFGALVFAYRVLHADRGAWIGLGLCVALQGWCYWFYGYFLTLFLILVCLCEMWRNKVLSPHLISDILRAVVVCLLCVSPAMWIMTMATLEGDVPGVGLERTWDIEQVQTQLVPWIRGFQLFEPIGQPYFRNVLWGGAACIGLVWMLKKPKWVLIAVGMVLISMGPVQTTGNESILNPLYLYLVQVLPYFERLWFPYRAAIFTFIALVVHLAEFLNTKNLSLHWRCGLPCIIIAAGVWDANYLHSLPLPHTELPRSSVEECLDAPTIQIPIGYVHPTMTWQVRNPISYFGGMGENGLIFLPQGYTRRLQNPFIEYLRSASLYLKSQKTFSPFDKDRIEQIGFRYILWDRSLTEMEVLKRKGGEDRPQYLFELQANLIEKLGPPICVDKQFIVFSLQMTDSSIGDVETLEQWSWEQPSLSGYEVRLRELGLVPD